MKGLPLDLAMLADSLSLAQTGENEGWQEAIPQNFLGIRHLRFRFFAQGDQLQALQLEVSRALLASPLLAGWLNLLTQALVDACRDDALAQELQRRQALPWPGLEEGDTLRTARTQGWMRATEFGRALALTAGTAPCSQCAAPLPPGAKRCWDCGQGLGMFGFLRKKG